VTDGGSDGHVVTGWLWPPLLLIWWCWVQAITKNTAHPFCIRQYATFQDKYHLYFLFDLMPGGDLMDVLVAEAKVIRQRVPSASWQVACLAPQVRHRQLTGLAWSNKERMIPTVCCRTAGLQRLRVKCVRGALLNLRLGCGCLLLDVADAPMLCGIS